MLLYVDVAASDFDNSALNSCQSVVWRFLRTKILVFFLISVHNENWIIEWSELANSSLTLTSKIWVPGVLRTRSNIELEHRLVGCRTCCWRKLISGKLKSPMLKIIIQKFGYNVKKVSIVSTISVWWTIYTKNFDILPLLDSKATGYSINFTSFTNW